MKFKLILFLTCILILLFFRCAFSHNHLSKILLVWSPMDDVVNYEIEISPRAAMDMTQPSADAVYRNNRISAPGVEIDTTLLPPLDFDHLFYRVRALTMDGLAISNYTTPEPLTTGIPNPISPYVTSQFTREVVPLYPTYSWIPVLGAAHYQVEVLENLPKSNTYKYNEQTYTTYVLDHGSDFDCYDPHAYTDPGIYYWRVIALDENDNPIGTYSDPVAFTVSTEPIKFAALGDSITHGGGAISNPPCDERFDYTSYFPFPVKNLGKSGDTIQDTAERFDSDVLPFHPSILLIMAGSNSIRAGESANNVIDELEIIKLKCLAANITPVFITLPPYDPDRIKRAFDQDTVPSWKSALKKVNSYILGQEYCIDVYPRLVGTDGNLKAEYSVDGLHPDITGKKIIAQTVLQDLQYYRLIN